MALRPKPEDPARSRSEEAYVEPLLPQSLVSRPLTGDAPVIEVAAGYRPDNPSPILKFVLEIIDTLTAARSGQTALGIS